MDRSRTPSAYFVQPVSVNLLAYCDDADSRQGLWSALRTCGELTVKGAHNGSLEAVLQHVPYDVCLVDGTGGLAQVQSLAEQFQRERRAVQFVCVLPADSERPLPVFPGNNVQWLDPAAAEPILQQIVAKAAERSRLMRENQRLKRRLQNRLSQELVGQCDPILRLREQIQQAASADGPALIQGEVGTGTNLVAELIHDLSERAHRPLIKIRCSVMTGENLHRELFGGGAVTDEATAAWRLEQADGGVLLLDDVESLPLMLQRQILRAFIYRDDSGSARVPNVRILAASHEDLKQAVDAGRFDRQLYEHLATTTLRVPALRERMEDLAMLVESILKQIAAREGRPRRMITHEAFELLKRGQWERNVCELQNVLQRACAIENEFCLTAESLAPWLLEPSDEEIVGEVGMTLREMERKLIESTFHRFAGNREKTAKALNIGIRTLSGKLREYGYPPRGGPGSNLRVATEVGAA